MVTHDRTRGGGSSASSFKIFSFNANSIGKNPKRQTVFHHIKKKNPDIVIACDTRICKSIENLVREEWGGKCVFNSFSSQARGVAIFIKKDFPLTILDEFCDTAGNILAVLFSYEEKRILLEGLYGPNSDEPGFYSDLAFKKIVDWAPEFSIFAGDFNLVLDPSIDTKNYLNINNPQAIQMLKSQMQAFNLIDIWRELHPNERIYTWQKFNANKCSRLDFFLISSSLLPFVKSADIVPGFCSDHSGISLEIDFSKFSRGRGFWKFNASLLREPEYVKLVKDTIKRVVAQYAVINGDPNFYTNATTEILNDFYATCSPGSLQHVSLKINPEAFLDVLFLEIRRITISFSSKRKKEELAKELKIISEIEVLEKRVAGAADDTFEEINEELSAKKGELEGIYTHQAEGAAVRARARYLCEGEKPTKLFCSLEKHNAIQKHIPKLVTENDGQKIVLTDQSAVEAEIFNYYSKLFTEKPVQIDEIDDFFTPEIAESLPKLSEIQKAKMEGLITLEEITRYLKKSKNNVSPGSTGFSNEFFKFFWSDLKLFIVKSVNYSYGKGQLSITQRLGIITLIPKTDKDKTFLKNWRPLTLLNSLYKLVSGCIAERIKPCLNSIIHSDQKGFVSDRYIGEAIRSTYDIIQWAKDNHKTGILLLIDFEKAYDSLSFSYIKKCLKYLNFGESLIKWVELLLHNFSAIINHCGNISKKLNIGCGARQGDPIASYLFIIAIEILAHKIRSDPQIEGFKLENLEHKLEMYADDCSIFLQPKSDNLRSTVKTLDCFYKLSGLKISVSKTKAVWFGKDYNNPNLCHDLQLDWDTNFRLLGIDFNNNLDNMETNFHQKIEIIDKLLNCWIYRTLTVYGKITVIKTLALPKLSHLALVLPNLNKTQIKIIETKFFKFLWGNKPDKVSRDHCKLPEKAGGLGFTDVHCFWQSLKFSWLRRLCYSGGFWPKLLELTVKTIVGVPVTTVKLLQFGPSKLSDIGKKCRNNFWKQIFSSAGDFMQGALFSIPENIVFAPFWNNPIIKRNRKAIKMSDFPEIANKMSIVADFYDQNSGDMLSKREFEQKFECQVSNETFLEIGYILNTTKAELGINNTAKIPFSRPIQPLLIKIINLTKKGCSSYSKLIRKKTNLTTNLSERENRWHLELQRTYGVEFWNKTYSLAASIKNENKFKYFQFQINRNSLYTNYKVHKFKPYISPLCTFCCDISEFAHNELVSHVFFQCDMVHNLWQDVKVWLATLNMTLPLNITKVLFGIHEEHSFSPLNYTILCVKYYIWRVKFQNKDLSLGSFQKYFFQKLNYQRNAFIYRGDIHGFEKMCIIYESLLRLPGCSAQATVAPMPAQVGEDITLPDLARTV